jgi:hypothetical protein
MDDLQDCEVLLIPRSKYADFGGQKGIKCMMETYRDGAPVFMGMGVDGRDVIGHTTGLREGEEGLYVQFKVAVSGAFLMDEHGPDFCSLSILTRPEER